MNKTACVTGHRPDRLGGFNGWRAEKCQKENRDKLIQVVYQATTAGYDTFITGMALGIDQLFAEAVLYVKENVNHDIKLIAAIPFPSQHKKWPLHAQRKYLDLLAKVDEVIYCNEDPYSAWKMQKRNEWMVDKSLTVIGVWNGGKGGTYNCIEYARKTNKPTLLINPYTLIERWR